MDQEQLKQLAAEQKDDNPIHSLTDVGTYCYSALTSVALNMLYDAKEVKEDSKFVDKTVKCLTSHLNQPQRVTDTALMIAKSVDIQHYQPFIESLKSEEIIQKVGCILIPKDLVLLGLQEGCYDSRMRTLIKFISLLLQVKWQEVEDYENYLVQSFKEQEHVASEEEIKEKASKAKVRKIKKFALIGAATVGGGVLIGLTGGLAAPLIAAGAGAVIGTAGAAALGSTAGIAIIGSLFGVAGAGLGGYKMNKRVGDVEEFTFEPLSEGSQLHVTIAITGWIKEECPDFAFAWRGLDNSNEQYVLRYESKYLKQMGSAMDYLVTIAVSQATTEALKYTVLASLMAAVIWPATIIAAAGVIDNPWSVLTNRTQQAGKMLAEVLLSRQQGRRPVTLIGFSLGARVIYYCLQEMAKRKNCEGIVEDAVMLGTPATASPKEWALLKRVVAGKIVNGFCRGDWLLKFLYRTASVQFSIAGLEPVKWTDRRMHNVDLTEIVEGHMDYMNKLDEILDIVGIKTKPHATERSSDNLKQWVTANKAKSAGIQLKDMEVELGEDVASILGENVQATPDMMDITENTSERSDIYKCSNSEAVDTTSNNLNPCILSLADAIACEAITGAKQSISETFFTTEPEQVSQRCQNAAEDMLNVPQISSLPSFDSGIGSSVAQDEEENLLVQVNTNNNVKQDNIKTQNKELCNNFDDLHVDSSKSESNSSP